MSTWGSNRERSRPSMSLSPQESLRGSKLPAFPTSSSFVVSSERFSPPPPRHRVGVNAIPARNFPRGRIRSWPRTPSSLPPSSSRKRRQSKSDRAKILEGKFFFLVEILFAKRDTTHRWPRPIVVACRLSIRKLKAHGEGADS